MTNSPDKSFAEAFAEAIGDEGTVNVPIPSSKRKLMTREESRQELIDNLTKASAWIDKHGMPGTYGDAYWLPPEEPLTGGPLDYFIDWVALIRIDDFQKRAPWFLGDMLNNMEKKWGETYSQVAEATGRSVNTLYRYSWVCRSIPWNVRRNPDDISFSTHIPVANKEYTAEDQDAWLQQCMQQKWTGEEFADKLKKEREAVLGQDGRSAQIPEGRALPAAQNSIPADRNLEEAGQETQTLGKNAAPAVAKYVSGREICCPHCGGISILPEWVEEGEVLDVI